MYPIRFVFVVCECDRSAWFLTRAAALRAGEYSRPAIITFYKSIWSLFYAEYFLYPFL